MNGWTWMATCICFPALLLATVGLFACIRSSQFTRILEQNVSSTDQSVTAIECEMEWKH